jgi:hypothetical protein
MRFVEAMQSPSARAPTKWSDGGALAALLRWRTRRDRGEDPVQRRSARMLSAPGSTWVHREVDDRVHLYGVREWELCNRLTRCAARRQWLP